MRHRSQLPVTTILILFTCLVYANAGRNSSHHFHTPRFLNEDDEDGNNAILTIPDAGRRFQLGQLYDARTEKLISALLWSKSLIDSNTKSTDSFFTDAKITTSDSLKDRAELLGINLEQTVATIVYPSVELEFSGSFNYLKEKQVTSKSVRMASSFKTRTRTYTIDVFSDQLLSPANINGQAFEEAPGCTSADKEKCKIATHFVSSITWGANVVTSFESVYTNEEERTKIEVALRGKLALPEANMQAEAEGSVRSDEEATDTLTSTKVSISGDLRLDRAIPTTVDSALEFIGELPALTRTMEGDGVPMDITLTPLSWVDSKAGRLARRIQADTLNRIIQIYDSFDQSDAAIRDTLSMDYGGFIAWKRAMDGFYIRFLNYRADFSLILGDAFKQIKGDTLDLRFMINLELSYRKSTNELNQVNIRLKLEQEEDIISNLMALASEFQSAGITFAENLRDYMAPTFDTRFDRVYALIMVGMNPNNDRPGIRKVREFLQLARARHNPGVKQGIDHCLYQTDPQRVSECTEDNKFVAIHFDSFCFDFCNSAFCVTEDNLPLCPRVSGTPPNCKMDATTANYMQCDPNLHEGRCGSTDEPDHLISNNEKPFSDCWCACPSTQVIEFVNNMAPRRLVDDMPRVPPEPIIVGDITSPPQEPDPLNQVVVLTLGDENALAQSAPINYVISIESRSVVLNDNTNDLEYETEIMDAFTTNTAKNIALRGLAAGEQYTLKVHGMNEVGIGNYAQSSLFTVGHRMIVGESICVLPKKDNECNQPKLLSSRTIPAWLDTRVTLSFSTKTPLQAVKVTLHIDIDLTVESGEFNQLTGSSASLAECNFAADESFSRRDELQCTFQLQRLFRDPSSSYKQFINTALDTDTSLTAYVAAWDDFGVLLAKGPWTLLLPTINQCSAYGSDNFLCKTSEVRKCVSQCDICGSGMNEFDGECLQRACQRDFVYCGVPFQHRPLQYREDKGNDVDLSESCLNKTEDTNILCKTQCHSKAKFNNDTDTDLCLPPCYMSFKGNYETDFVIQRGITSIIGCADGYVAENGSNFTFTCPDSPGDYDDGGKRFTFDDKVVRSMSPALTSIAEEDLICSQCQPGQTYDMELEDCVFAKPDKVSMNLVLGGSFMNDMDMVHFVKTGDKASAISIHPDISADIDGGSLFIPTKCAITQQIMVSTGKIGAGRKIFQPKSGTIWAMSLYFKVPPDFKGTEKPKEVGTMKLGTSLLNSKIGLVIPAGQMGDWVRVDLRHKFHFVDESDVGVTLGVEITLGDKSTGGINIDMIEVVIIEGFAEYAFTTNDVMAYTREHEHATADVFAEENVELPQTKTTFVQVQREYNTDNKESQTKDTEQDNHMTSLKNIDDSNKGELATLVRNILLKRITISFHQREKKRRCAMDLFRHYNPKIC